MRALVLEGFDSSPALREVPTPQIAPNEVLVRVGVSSVNPVDGAIAAGMMSAMVEHEFPVVLGRDYAGVVEQAGSDVTRYAEGEEVYGFLPAANPTVHDGTWAELIVVPEDNFVAGKPAGVELAEAGAAPLSGITALSALDALGVSEGDTVLVVGANGGRRQLLRPARRQRRRNGDRPRTTRGRAIPARLGHQRGTRSRGRRRLACARALPRRY